VPTRDEQIEQLTAGIAALEAQRATLGDAMVEAMLTPIREKLAALEAQPRADQRRKLATVLFADVSGFTAMSETMDAEDVAAIMNDLWVTVDKVITDHGGRIDKHIGDAVMALWGAEAGREDDPEQAVRAALAMQAAIVRFRAVRGATLAMRAGVNTGPVVTGLVGTMGEFTALGDAVNLASRLEHAAQPGEVLIGHDTYRLVRGIFDVLPQAPLAIKGKAEPVQTYIVRQAKPRAFRMATRGVEGIETHMVGRDAELDTLKRTCLDTFETAETRVVTIVGEAGVGKSRLLYEFDNWIELRPESIWYFKGRSMPITQNIPYSLFRDLLTYRFEILESDTIAVTLDKFRRGMAGVLEPDQADIVGHWLGFDFSTCDAVAHLRGGADFTTAARAFLTRYFRELSAAGPVVILLEDLHWTDDQSLDLIIHLVGMLPDRRLLIICAARPSFLERRPYWGEGEAAFSRIRLRPISRRAGAALVDQLLQRVDEVPESLRDLIVESADGNPFYLEELVKMLIEQGVIERPRDEDGDLPHTAGTWRVRTEKLMGLNVPPTLTALLQARLDGLPRPERKALQRASVVGRLFWDDAVADLLQLDLDNLTPELESIRRRELIFRREHSSFAGTCEYIFKHALLRDVTYETVLLKNRAELHGRVARWLEANAGERLGEYLGLIAEHYIESGEGLRAAELLERAAGEAFATGLYAAAGRGLERALALREAAGEMDSPAITHALISLGEVYRRLFDFPAAEATLGRGLIGALTAGDEEAAALARANLLAVAVELGQFDQARALRDETLPAARAVGGRTLIVALDMARLLEWVTGDLDAAESHAREILGLAQQMGDLAHESRSLNILASIAHIRREHAEAERLYQESLALARRSNNPDREAVALANLGNHYYACAEYDNAVTFGNAALSAFREMGLDGSVLMALGNLAQANLMLGDRQSARDGATEALALARKVGAEPYVAWAVSLFGQILIAEGRPARGLALYGLVRVHPALTADVRLEIDEALAALALPREELEAELAAGTGLDLTTVVGEILDGKW